MMQQDLTLAETLLFAFELNLHITRQKDVVIVITGLSIYTEYKQPVGLCCHGYSQMAAYGFCTLTVYNYDKIQS